MERVVAERVTSWRNEDERGLEAAREDEVLGAMAWKR